MLIARRNFIFGVGALTRTMVSGDLCAAEISGVSLTRKESDELGTILESARQIGVHPLGGSRGFASPDLLDVSKIILDALELEQNKSKAIALAKQAGHFLSRVNQKQRDQFSARVDGRAEPPFDAKEKRRLRSMFESCELVKSHEHEIKKAVALMGSPPARTRYEEVSEISGVPWYIIASLHLREANLNFFGHLHNGDPLDHKTVQVPKGRPRGVWPPVPFDPRAAWRTSAVDALKDFSRISEWTVERTLFGFEAYNGFGYRPHHVNSPYVWNYSQFYRRGGFPCDHCWSDSYVSRQPGLGLIVRALSQQFPYDIKLQYENDA